MYRVACLSHCPVWEVVGEKPSPWWTKRVLLYDDIEAAAQEYLSNKAKRDRSH